MDWPDELRALLRPAAGGLYLVSTGRAAQEKLQRTLHGAATDAEVRPAQTIDAIVAHLRGVGAESIYFSNDIDGTDAEHADATGTPEPWGLEPEWLVKLIRRLGAELGLCGGDIMEVAPPLRQIKRGAGKTTRLAARYLREQLAAGLRGEL